MGSYKNNKDGTSAVISTNIQVVDAPMEEFLSRGEFNAVTPNDVGAQNKLVAENEVTKAVSTMPTASSSLVGTIVQYVGTTSGGYTNGYFYKCVSDGAVNPTYSWTRVDVQPSGGGSGDMLISVYDSDSSVANAGGIESYVEDEILPIWQAQGQLGAKNLLIYPYSDGQRKTTVGVTFTANNDGSITSNGTTGAGQYAVFWLENNVSFNINDLVTLSTSELLPTNVSMQVNGNAYIDRYHPTVDFTVAQGDTLQVKLVIEPSTTVDNITVYPMLRLASDPDSTWQPYASTNKELTDKVLGKMDATNPIGTGSFSLNRKANTTIGNYSVAEGYDCTASRYYAHAEGCETNANGLSAHAEGDNTNVNSNYAHAEGGHTTANGMASHAEGYYTTTSRSYAHAEGGHTTASGEASHAEGNYTTANADASHAEGNYTTANGRDSHTEGRYSVSANIAAHAEGGIINAQTDKPSSLKLLEYDTENQTYIPTSDNSFDENKTYYTKPILINLDFVVDDVPPIARGWLEQQSTNVYIRSTDFTIDESKQYYYVSELSLDYYSSLLSQKAEGIFSHAEGFRNYAFGNYSHAEGNSTCALNDSAHAEGNDTHASGACSHAEGYQTTASLQCCHAEGTRCQANGNTSHAEGHRSQANGDTSHAEGSNTEANGGYSHVSGYSTIADGHCQTVIGSANVAQGSQNSHSSTDYAFIIGNGTSVDDRSNALAIKWDGTFVFANGTEISPAQFTALLALLN